MNILVDSDSQKALLKHLLASNIPELITQVRLQAAFRGLEDDDSHAYNIMVHAKDSNEPAKPEYDKDELELFDTIRILAQLEPNLLTY